MEKYGSFHRDLKMIHKSKFIVRSFCILDFFTVSKFLKEKQLLKFQQLHSTRYFIFAARRNHTE